MLITCPKCKKCRNVDDSLIPKEARTVRCKECGERFPLSRNSSNERPGTMPASAGFMSTGTPDRNDMLRKNGQGFAAELPAPAGEARDPRIIGVMISKGGVGKTTTAVNLAAALSQAGRRVLLVDTDTQGQSAYALGVKPENGLADLIAEEAEPEEVIFQARENLWLIGGGKPLAGIKRLIDRKEFGAEMTLKETLDRVAEGYDYVIVDSSPGWDPLTVNVLFFVREVLVPVSLEVMPLQGLREFQKSFEAVARYNKSIELKYIVPTFLDLRVRHPRAIYKKLKELYRGEMCPPVRYNVRLSEAPAYGMTIFEYSPDSNGAEDYRALAERVIRDEAERERACLMQHEEKAAGYGCNA